MKHKMNRHFLLNRKLKKLNKLETPLFFLKNFSITVCPQTPVLPPPPAHNINHSAQLSWKHDYPAPDSGAGGSGIMVIFHK
jgi:hypothetical protein